MSEPDIFMAALFLFVISMSSECACCTAPGPGYCQCYVEFCNPPEVPIYLTITASGGAKTYELEFVYKSCPDPDHTNIVWEKITPDTDVVPCSGYETSWTARYGCNIDGTQSVGGLALFLQPELAPPEGCTQGDGFDYYPRTGEYSCNPVFFQRTNVDIGSCCGELVTITISE